MTQEQLTTEVLKQLEGLTVDELIDVLLQVKGYKQARQQVLADKLRNALGE